MIQKFFPAIFILLAVFTVQTLDIPPLSRAANPKTCCGRSVCLCKHDKGAPCPLRQHRDNGVKPALMKESLRPASAMPKSCHLHRSSSGDSVQKLKNEMPSGFLFTKAPCHKDAPLSLVTGFCKDFTIENSVKSSPISTQSYLLPQSLNARIFLWQQGIDRPPKAFSLSR